MMASRTGFDSNIFKRFFSKLSFKTGENKGEMMRCVSKFGDEIGEII
jgi:hypothetical protein